MKEATGELSTTVIAIVAIAAILAVFTVILLPMIRSQITLTQACNNGPGYTTNYESGRVQVQCGDRAANGANAGTWTCSYFSDDAQHRQQGQKTCRNNN